MKRRCGMTILEQDRKVYRNLNNFDRDKLNDRWKDWGRKFPLCNEVMFGRDEFKKERLDKIIEATIK